MNDNLNNIFNISEYKQEFLKEINELYDNINQIQDDFTENEKEAVIKLK